MISSTAVVACDRCGRTFGQGTEAPFTFCSGCALYVCRSCWSPTFGQCLSCSFPDREPSQIAARRSIRDTIAPPLDPDPGHRIPMGPGRPEASLPTQPVAGSRRAPTARRGRPAVRLGAILSFLVEDLAFRVAIAAMVAVAAIAAVAFVGAGGDPVPMPEPTPPASAADNAGAPAGGATPAAATPPPTRAGTAVTTHTVAPGESLYELAERYYGDGSMWRTIYEANAAAITDPDELPLGLILTIPEP